MRRDRVSEILAAVVVGVLASGGLAFGQSAAPVATATTVARTTPAAPGPVVRTEIDRLRAELEQLRIEYRPAAAGAGSEAGKSGSREAGKPGR